MIKELTKEALVLYEKAKEERGREGGREGGVPECVLDLLVQQKEEGVWSLEKVVADLFAFVFAAFTNSFAVLAWCLYEMAGNEEVRTRFVNECNNNSNSSSSSSSGATAAQQQGNTSQDNINITRSSSSSSSSSSSGTTNNNTKQTIVSPTSKTCASGKQSSTK